MLERTLKMHPKWVGRVTIHTKGLTSWIKCKLLQIMKQPESTSMPASCFLPSEKIKYNIIFSFLMKCLKRNRMEVFVSQVGIAVSLKRNC